MKSRLAAAILALAVLNLALALPCDARKRWDVGIHAGPDLAGIYGVDADSLGADNRTGLAVGIWGTNWLSDNVGVRLEVMYAQKGATQKQDGEKLTAELDYIDIPLLILFARELTPNQLFINMHVGPVLGLKVHAEFDSSGTVTRDLDASTTDWDFGGALGVGFSFRAAQRLDITLDLRYTVSFVSIDDTPSDFDFRNNVFAILLGVQSRLGYW